MMIVMILLLALACPLECMDGSSAAAGTDAAMDEGSDAGTAPSMESMGNSDDEEHGIGGNDTAIEYNPMDEDIDGLNERESPRAGSLNLLTYLTTGGLERYLKKKKASSLKQGIEAVYRLYTESGLTWYKDNCCDRDGNREKYKFECACIDGALKKIEEDAKKVAHLLLTLNPHTGGTLEVRTDEEDKAAEGLLSLQHQKEPAKTKRQLKKSH